MTKPIPSNPLLPSIAHRAHIPVTSQIVRMDRETRVDLPFYLVFENLTYIGVVVRETWHVRPHYHDHFELCYIDEGQGWFTIDGLSYQVRTGDLFLTKPGEIHQGAAAGDCPFRLYYLGFSLNKLTNLEMDYYQLGVQRVVADVQNTVREIFKNILDELLSDHKHALEMVQGLFLRLLVHTLRAYEKNTATISVSVPLPPVTPMPLPPSLRQVLYLIHAEAGNCYSVSELAICVNLSRSHLSREFKRLMGVSLGHYMRILSLDWAKQYLRESEESISIISQRLHFPSIYTFSQFFKRHTGMSPLEYRRKIQKTHLSSG